MLLMDGRAESYNDFFVSSCFLRERFEDIVYSELHVKGIEQTCHDMLWLFYWRSDALFVVGGFV